MMMKDFADVVSALGDLAGPEAKTLDNNQTIEIPIEGIGILEISSASPDAFDLVMALDLSIDAGEGHPLRVLLGANYLGDGTGPARVGIANNEIVLSQRIAIVSLTAAGMQTSIDEFIARAAYWSSGAIDQFVAVPRKMTFEDYAMRV